MTDGLDVVRVGVEDESAEVARVVLRPFAGDAIVAIAGLGGDGVEALDRRNVGGTEGQVDVLRRRAAVDEREATTVVVEPPTRPLRMIDGEVDTNNRRDRLVERLAVVDIGGA